MWGVKTSPGHSSQKTVIGPNTVLTGDVHFTGTLRLEGRIEGNLVASEDLNARVEIASGAVVCGQLNVPFVVVNGTVQGNLVSCKKVSINRDAQVGGDVHYNVIELATGATLEGQAIRLPDRPESSDAESPTHDRPSRRSNRSVFFNNTH